MRGRPPLRKQGAFTAAERARRYRQNLKKLKASQPSAKTLAKQQRRAERESALAAATCKAAQSLGRRLYGVLYADPPWRFEPYSRESGMDRAADNHYPTMTLDAIKALDVPAAKDSVLYLWAPMSRLDDAVDLIRAWGFEFKAAHVWGKPDLGTGYLVRENAELLLIASRGSPAWPAPGQQSPSLIMAARGEPSAKPEPFAEMIGRLWPNTAKLEMFARRRREGWDAWGNEVEDEAAE
jgi:N6-adenosine-specific RNA methylase IME4